MTNAITSKPTVAVIFGGTNTEHEVSIVSARSIIKHLDKTKYNIRPIKISKTNQWLIPNQNTVDINHNNWIETNPFQILNQADIIFPVIHGSYGEDGTIQGLFEILKKPYVGCNTLASAICMDKVIQKQLTSQAGILSTKYIHLTKHQWVQDPNQWLQKIESNIGFPNFVKPANQGSSIGVTMTNNNHQLHDAIEKAVMLDLKIIIEKAVLNAREIECSILGNNNPQASVLGEIIPSGEFYDYDAKYVDGKSKDYIPAKLDPTLSKKIQHTAIKAYKILNCSGLARIDFLLDSKSNIFYLNELNTMPGFTNISMYPKLWHSSGIEYPQLLEKLLQLAIENHQTRSQLNYSYTPKSNWYQL